MEQSHTTTQHWVWTLWPHTPVNMDTLSMEILPGLVGVMECGVSQLHPPVNVSGTLFMYVFNVFQFQY